MQRVTTRIQSRGRFISVLYSKAHNREMDRIETERLTLRAFEPTDVKDVFREIYSTADVWGPKPRQFADDSVAMAV